MLAHKRVVQRLPAVALILMLLPLSGGAAGAAPGVHARFQQYYEQYQGLRVLGHPLTDLTQAGGYPAQYFEKGCIEDHQGAGADPHWAFMYSRLTAILMERDPAGPVSATSVTYGDLQRAAAPALRRPAPAGFTGGTRGVHDGQFVPFDANLRPAPGHIVAPYFWAYITRADLFPGGWLHDIGLPMTEPLAASVVKQGAARPIILQAFERTVLSYDPQNPAGWQVERANIGADALRTLPRPVDEATISIPAPGARVLLPLHILAQTGRPGDQVTAVLTWRDGTTLTNRLPVLPGPAGQGLVVANLDWVNLLQPPEPPTQPATLALRDAAGRLLASQEVTLVSPNDPGTQQIQLYWTVSGAEVVTPQPRRILKTARIGTAALEELLWGPPAVSQVGYHTALPAPEQVLGYPGRAADWGPRVTLRSLNISGGVATADFSQELRAYGGGSLRVRLIRAQITRTLMQFPTVQQVRIAIEGRTDGVLEP